MSSPLTSQAIIGSAVLYQEFRDVTLPQFINFAFGVSPHLSMYSTTQKPDITCTSVIELLTFVDRNDIPRSSSAHFVLPILRVGRRPGWGP